MLSKKIVIAGGTGEVGCALADLFYEQGYEIHVISRNQDKIEKLRSQKRDYFFYCIDCAEYESCISLAEKLGQIDIFISSLGGFVETENLINLGVSAFDKYFRETLLSQFNLLKCFLAKSKNYVFINGEAGLQPMPNYGLVSVFDKAQIMLGEVIATENPDKNLHQVIICEKVSPTDLPVTEVFKSILDLMTRGDKIVSIGKRAELLKFSN